MDENSKYVILTFDDAWSSQYKAFNLLKPLKGTLYICSSFIGEKDRLSLDNLKEMYDNGWDISNHTVHHINLSKVDIKKAYDEVYGCSSWIAGNGFTRDNAYKHFAYPEGGYNKEIIEMLKKQNILTARTTNAGNDTTEFLELGRTSLHGMSKENIRNKIVSDEKLLIISFHRIVPDETKELKEIDLMESYFMEVIEAIQESERKVITITEWYEMNK
jgi:peptidoglycan/xylan/chitin deacetylase (PgdA/CDA1 family)